MVWKWAGFWYKGFTVCDTRQYTSFIGWNEHAVFILHVRVLEYMLPSDNYRNFQWGKERKGGSGGGRGGAGDGGVREAGDTLHHPSVRQPFSYKELYIISGGLHWLQKEELGSCPPSEHCCASWRKQWLFTCPFPTLWLFSLLPAPSNITIGYIFFPPAFFCYD